MKDFYFIGENSNEHKVKVFLIGAIILIISIGLIITIANTFDEILLKVPQLESVKESILNEVGASSSAGLFYIGFAGGLFFIALPQELFYYYGLMNGNPIFISFLTINAGVLLAQIINYFAGVKLSKILLYFVSKKKVYKAKRFINKRGGIGIFLFNFLPLPFPLLTFALGIAKYNIYRLFYYYLLGTLLKYIFIVLFFFLMN